MSGEWVDVKAKAPLEYQGRRYKAGEWFRARAVDALTMGESGVVSLNREYSTRAALAESQPTEKPSRRAYKRRDMTAERS